MFKQITLAFAGFVALSSAQFKQDCSNFNGEMGCRSGQITTNPDDWSQRSFQTYLPGDPNYYLHKNSIKLYKEGYEGLGRVMCYSSILYTSDKKSATVDVRCRQHSSVTKVEYNFNNKGFQDSNESKVDSSFTDVMPISVKATDGNGQSYSITLEPLNFIWQGAPINQGPQYKGGQKGAIVEMFGWPYADIKQECSFLGKAGYMGVKVFPPQETVFTFEWPQNGELNPWWFYYQPVSYKLTGRHGTREELRDMIQTCRSAGVRVYADAVVNHMSGGGNDIWPLHRNGGGGGFCATWEAKASTGTSPYFTHNFISLYQIEIFMFENSSNTGLRPGCEFPAVPYIATDFHCERSLSSWTDPFALGNGWLSGLADLDTESEYVQERIASYFVDLLSIGFSGFRIDAAKHIQPKSLSAILNRLKKNLGGGDLPEDFITWLEVIIGGEKDLLMCGDNDYNYGKPFEGFMKAAGLSDNSDIYKVKIWSSDYPKEFPICGYWSIPSERYVIQNDCHDDQNPGSSSRDMGDKGSVLVQAKDVNKHRDFEKQLFSRTDGNWQIKAVLSSYTFMNNGAMGIPDGKSDCANCVGTQCNSCSKSMKFSQAYDPNSCGYDCDKGGWQEGVYTRVHRDAQIIQAMRQWQGLSSVNNVSELGLPSNCGNHAKSFLNELQ